MGAVVERRGQALVGRIGDGERPIVLAAHMDTVWPVGTLPRMPFRIEDGYAWGPGTLDMKAGIVTGIEALRRIGKPSRPVAFLVTADEEIGSPAGRPLVEELARQARAVLVLEPPVRDASITTSRSGLARYQLRITGRAAHAGNGKRRRRLGGRGAGSPDAGRPSAPGAIEGARVNVGQVGGGTGDNVVAGEAWARIDARAWTSDAQLELEHALRSLKPQLDGAQIEVAGGITRPPMLRSPESEALAARTLGIAAGLGIPLEERRSAGGSDGNFAAAVGAPVLDGLGPTGVGAHAVDERVSIESLEERTQLLEALVREL